MEGRAPYPTGFAWDPVESLQELNKLRLGITSQETQQYQRQYPPALPPKPQQYQQPLSDPNESYRSNSYSDWPSPSTPVRPRGPRVLPDKFSSPLGSPYTSPTHEYQLQQQQQQQQQYPYKMESSPLNGPRPQRSPPEKLNSINTSFNSTWEDLMDSPSGSFSKLPDIPALTPIVQGEGFLRPMNSRSPRNSRNFTKNSPSPTRSLTGPRSMPFNKNSPTRVDYYDHRNSWKSDFDLDIIDIDKDFHRNQQSDISYIESNPARTETSRISSVFDPESILIPEETVTVDQLKNIGTVPSYPSISSNNRELDKRLPKLPAETLSLPSLPFSSYSLLPHHLNKCPSVAYLSHIFHWSIRLANEWSEGLLISRSEFQKSLMILITHKLPDINKFIVENNVDLIIQSFEKQNSIYFDEKDNVHFLENVNTSGILTQLTGCYSDSHDKIDIYPYQCYSPRCSLTVYQNQVEISDKRVDASHFYDKLGEWADYWKLTSQDLKEIGTNEIKKQSHTFELIRQQQNIIKLGEIQVNVYGESFKKSQPQLLPDVQKFYNDAFNSVKPLLEIHKKYLLIPLIQKLNVQGKFITGIGEIFSNWLSIATVPYLKYAEKMATVRELIKYEKSKQNSNFTAWLLRIDTTSKEVLQSSLDHNRIFFSGFIGHTQLLSLALLSVFKKLDTNDLDYKPLDEAIEGVNLLNRKIDQMQETALQHRHLKLLASQLLWKSSVLKTDLKLTEASRRLIKKGPVLRKREKWITSTCYLILLDNYLLVTELKDSKDHSADNYKIIEKPIPIEFLQVESKTFQQPNDSFLNDGESFPFKVRYSGQNISFTFYTKSLNEKELWFQEFNKIKVSKSKSNVNSEVFRISVLTDTFAYDNNEQTSQLPICPKGSNLDIALNEYEEEYKTVYGIDSQKCEDFATVSRPSMLSGVLSSCEVEIEEKEYVLIGLNYGLFMAEANDPYRGWKRVLDLKNITQLEQLDTLVIVLSDSAVYSFNIISLLLNYYNKNSDHSIIGERLSKRDVVLFKIGNYYNTQLLFIMKSGLAAITPGSNSTVGIGSSCRFKIFTPIFDSFNNFQFFQIYKKFNLDYSCFGVSIFNSMFVINSVKGFEILSFTILNESTRIPKFIQAVKKPKTELELIKKNINSLNVKPLKMFKVYGKPQFYLIYETFAMVIDTMGQLINDSFILPFKFKCSRISLSNDNYLICVGNDIVEIFDLDYDESSGFDNYDPIQIINGKNIKLIDEINTKLVLAHPRIPGRQLVIKLERI